MDADDGLPHIIIVGGGAGGLELATRLGDKLGRKGKARISLVERARTHVWKPLLHEIAAGSMDVAPPRARISGAGLLARVPVPLRRDDRHRPQEAARVPRRDLRRGGPRDHADALLPLRHAGHRHRLRRQRFQHARRQGVRHHAGHARAGRALQSPADQCLRARLRAGGADPPRAAARRDHRRRRDRHRTCRRAAPNRARPRRLRPRQDRSREGHQDHADRGGAAHPAGTARAHLEGGRRSPARVSTSKSEPARA